MAQASRLPAIAPIALTLASVPHLVPDVKKIIAGVTVVLVIAVIVLALVPFDSPELGRRLLARLGERTGMELEADAFRFSLLRGVTIRGICGASHGVESDLDLEIDAVTLEHRLLPLLRGDLVFDRIDVDHPRVELHSKDPGNLAGAAAVPGALAAHDPDDSGPRLVISSMSVRDGAFVAVSDGEPGMEIRGLRLEIDELRVEPSATGPARLSGHGTIATEAIRLGELVARESEGPVKLEGGKVILDGHRFTTDLGEFVAETFEIDPTAEPLTYRLVLHGDPLHVAELLRGTGGSDAGTFLLDGAGRGTEKHDLRGKGRLHLPGGEVPSSPYLELVEVFLGGLPIVGEPWKPVDVDYEIADNRVRLVPFTLVTETARLDVAGGIDLEGPLKVDLRVGVPRDRIRVDEIPDELLDVLTDANGQVSIPLAMRGTIEAPRLRPDWEALADAGSTKAGREAGRKLLDAIDQGLKRLFDD